MLKGDGVYQPGAGSFTSDLEEVCLGPVPVPMGTFRVECDGPGSQREGGQAGIERLGGVHQRTQGLPRLLDELVHERPGNCTTPRGSGGRPEMCPRRSCQALRWTVILWRLSRIGVQDARTSTSAWCVVSSPNPRP